MIRAIFSILCFSCICLSSTAIAYDFNGTKAFALKCDSENPVAKLRQEFLLPKTDSSSPIIYFCGHSLGLQPRATRRLIGEELNAWEEKGVKGHFKDENPWYSYHTLVRDPLARLVGAHPHEVVAMNSLTVNLHLMMISFYAPKNHRYKVLMEAPVFPSDTYAVKSQVQLRGYNPDDAVIIAEPRQGEECLRTEDIEALLDTQGDEIALVLFSAVNYFSGQFVDMERITKKAHEKGCLVGFDLAHAIGNVPMQLHNWDVDFAVWCSYKYLCAGPGAIGGAFVHERHSSNPSLHRLAGWWGNDPDTRFQLHLEPNFNPVLSADGWQISNPSIFSLIPLRASLDIIDSIGIKTLRERSVQLTAYLEYLLDEISSDRLSIITPRDPKARGCQISIRVDDRPEELMDKFRGAGIICDYRRPDVLRIAPNPLYNTFHEVWQLAKVLREYLLE